MQDLAIIYQDDHIIAINKPAGLLTVPGLATPDNAFDQLVQQHPNSRVVHRLDMATSGLVIFPQSHESLVRFGRLFEQRKMTKTYTAMVAGIVAEDRGEITLPLICDWPNRPKQKVDQEQGKHAHTRYNVLERRLALQTTRVELTPITGRSHQLRVHMQQLGHPILGDAFYAPDAIRQASDRLLLHATTLEFVHPFTHNPTSIHCEPDF
ncbi:RluA family pseudouridine synthase [Teredinibacter turnerae]|uniref:RluA family pseudouridine synthase n=1 Tax=Teredinibacter turnerae TaxID=2426 RepID=UPI0005F86AC3|nr:RluA family pseudouridine synthase [Teredinibacter turnerae]